MRNFYEQNVFIIHVFTAALIFAALLFAFESGQRRVDRWEQETGRYGEGLR